MPKLGIAESRAASDRLMPRTSLSAGIRKAMPLMKTVAHNVAMSATASSDQRRVDVVCTY